MLPQASGAGLTYLLRDVYFCHYFLPSKQADVTQSFLSILPAFEVGRLAKTTSQECCKSRPLLPTIPCDPCSPRHPLVSGSKVAPRDFAALLSQLPVGLSYQLGLSSSGEKRQAACRDPAAVMLQVRRVEVSKKWKMKICCLLKTCQ